MINKEESILIALEDRNRLANLIRDARLGSGESRKLTIRKGNDLVDLPHQGVKVRHTDKPLMVNHDADFVAVMKR